ncbi:FAD-dependent oxidoreductase [Blautia coccoides]|uniref:NAD(P)/FAD-dependent oxidoreductase n=1 Tax=Blautia producta TaxID=33035 RepID=UPI0021091026|nr:FAD-dependent oxidoreductase [Blautia coccoides]MCQ4641043.1 FAD-dependent oxidoreductase [Blautia coccoides]
MKYVIPGSSAAGVNAAKEIRRVDKGGEIVMISGDETIYSRCILHHYLGNIRTVQQLNFTEPDYTEKYRIQFMRGREAVSVNCEERTVLLKDGESVGFDRLLIATGSHTFIPPVKGMREAGNVIGFRNLSDIDRIKEILPKAKHVVVMGAGLVGLDTISGLLDNNVKPTVVELADHLLCRQLDKEAASVYESAMVERGVKQYYGVSVQEVFCDREGNIKELALSDSSRIPCDFLIVTAGVRANVEFLEGCQVETDRFGLLFNVFGETNVPGIYGAGDVSGRAPIWPVAVKEGIIAGSNMAGVRRKMTDFFASKSTMNFFGIPTMSLGQPDPQDETELVETQEGKDGYKKIIHKDGRILGAVIQGDLSYSGVLQQLIARRIDVSKVRKPLFEIDYSDFFHVSDNFEFYYQEDTNDE